MGASSHTLVLKVARAGACALRPSEGGERSVAQAEGEGGKGGGELTLSKAECTNLETQAEPQQIVAQGLLSCLQYLVS